MSGPYKKCEPGAMPLHDATTTGNGNILLCKGDSRCVTIMLQSNGTTSGGTLSIEEAFYRTADGVYSGTWSVIQTISASTITGSTQQFVHILGASVYALRVRISSDITGGGTVTVWAWGN